MSEQQNNAGNQGNRDGNQGRGGRGSGRGAAKQAGPPKIPPEENLSPAVKGSNDVPKYTRLWIGGTGGTSDLVVHRPIGKTDLDKDNDWVISSPSQIKDMINRKENPRINEINANRKNHRLEKAVRAGLIQRHTDGSILYPNGVNRETSRAEAKGKAYAAAGKTPTAAQILAQQPQDEQAAETAFSEAIYSENYMVESELAFPDNHITTWGQNFEPQVRCEFLSGITEVGVATVLQQRMFNPPANQVGGVFIAQAQAGNDMIRRLTRQVEVLERTINQMGARSVSGQSVPTHVGGHPGRGGGRHKKSHN